MSFFPFVLLVALVLVLLSSLIFRDTKRQNLILLIISYMFYAWWDWRFLALLSAVSGMVYLTAKHVHTSRLALSIRLDFPLFGLGICKYLYFFPILFMNCLEFKTPIHGI